MNRHIWTIRDIADYTGYSRMQINSKKPEIEALAKRLKRGPWRVRYNADFGELLESMKKTKAAASNAPKVRKKRPSRKALYVCENKTAELRDLVSSKAKLLAEDKQDALLYYECLAALADALGNLWGKGKWWIGPWRLNPAILEPRRPPRIGSARILLERRVQLFEGIHAAFKIWFDLRELSAGNEALLWDLKEMIEQLPTTPQTEQSSLNASEK